MLRPLHTCISYLFDKTLVTTWFTHDWSVQCLWPSSNAKSMYASRKPHGQMHMHMHASRRIRGLSIVHTRGGYIISQAVL